jgi:ABC-type Zn uptake system ZnuABC Zn-binding protein ZnuA
MSLVGQADLLISAHPSIEEGIAKVLDNIDIQRKLYVVEKPTQQLNNEHEEHEEHEHHGAHEDYHIWLNINAIQKVSTRLSNKLIAIDIDNRLIYQSNLSLFNKKLDALKT